MARAHCLPSKKFAVLVQIVVCMDIFRNYNKTVRNCWAVVAPVLAKCGFRAAADEEFSTTSSIYLVVLLVLTSEIIFAVLCLVQCAINFHARKFVDTTSACVFQAVYATHYMFSSMGLAAYGIASSHIFVSETVFSKSKSSALGMIGVSIHVTSLVIAVLPFMAVGSYLFAKDYCMYNIESPFYSALYLAWFGICVFIAAGGIWKVWMLSSNMCMEDCNGKRSSAMRQLAWLLLGLGIYFLAFAWGPSLAIVMYWLVHGKVYDSAAWRLYGAQAIILHSNQLFVPILF